MTTWSFMHTQRTGSFGAGQASTAQAAVAADIERCAPLRLGELPASAPVLLAALANHHGLTYVHSLRVAQFAWTLAQAQNRSPSVCRWVYLAGLLHDVGKMFLPRAVLRDEDTLTRAEQDLLHTHAARGALLLQQHHDLAALAPSVAAQNERPDGWGTPHGLLGEEIPVPAAFVAVAEALDAMVFPADMRSAASPARVRDMLLAGAGERWDARIVATAAHLVVHGKSQLIKTRVEEVANRLLAA